MAGNLRATLSNWWADAGDYQWLVAFLHSRNLLTSFKRFVGALGLVMAILAALMQFEPTVDHGPNAQITLIAVVLCGVGWALRWWIWDWPSLRESAVLVALGDSGIAAAALLGTDPLSALAGTPLFAALGAYLAFFHTPRIHAAHIAFSTVTIAGISVWLASQYRGGGIAVAMAKGGIALLLTVTIIPALHLALWLIGTSATDSLTDPLTGLKNRRGLDHAMNHMMAATSGPVSALVVDIDSFKAVNDKGGHPVGDAVLVRTAARIRSCVASSALVVRLGGEEFLIVDQVTAADAAAIGERLRTKIAEPGDPVVTASVGVATIDRLYDGHIDTLISIADAAMYEAKRCGGNRVIAH